MTVSELLSDAYRRLNYSTTPATDVTTRLLAFLNDAHRELLTMPGMDQLRDDQITVASVSGQARMGLPPSVGRIQAMLNRTNMILLAEVTMQEVRRRNPGLTYTGIPTVFARQGVTEVSRQPVSTGSGLWVGSTDAADNAKTVKIRAIRLGGYLNAPADTALGAGRTAVGALTDYVDVTQFSLPLACAGDVSLFDAAAAGNVLAVIPRGQTFARYQAIQFDPVPSSAITYTIDYTRIIPELVAGTDEPLLPLDFHRVIALGIRKNEYEKNSDSRYPQAMADYEAGKRALRSWAQNDGTATLSLRANLRAGRPSQLGAYYPAGS